MTSPILTQYKSAGNSFDYTTASEINFYANDVDMQTSRAN